MTRKLLLIIVGFFLCLSGHPQQTRFDSLYNANAGYEKQDEKKLRLLNNLSDEYQFRQLDSGIVCADKAIFLAQKLTNPKGLAAACNNKAINCINKGNFSAAEELLKRAFNLYTRIKNKTGIADNYLYRAKLSRNHGDLDSASILLDKAYELYKQTGEKNGMGYALYWKGCVLWDDTGSIRLYNKAIRIFEQTGNEAGLGLTYDGLGCYYQAFGKYPTSLEWFNKAIKINKQNNLLYNLAADYNNISRNYYLMADYASQLECLLKALRLTEITGSLLYEAYCLSAISTLYMDLKQYPVALKYISRSIDLTLQIGVDYYLTDRYVLIGTVYSKMNNYNKAFEYFEKAQDIAIKRNDEETQSLCYTSMAKAYIELRQYDKAFLYYRKTMEIDARLFGQEAWIEDYVDLGKCILYASDAILIQAGIDPAKRHEIAVKYFQQVIRDGERGLKRDAFFELSHIYEKEGDIVKSFDYYKQYIAMKDSIMNAENSKNIGNMQIQYDTEKKEQQIVLLNKDKQIQLQEINKQKLVRNGFIAGFAVVLLFAGVFFRQRNKIKKGNIALQVAKERAEQSEQFKQQFLANMSHEIRTPMNAVMGMTSLVLNTPLQEKQKFYLEGIKKSSDTLLHIINDILDLSKIEAGKMELEKIDFSLKDSLNQVKQTLNHRAEEKGLALLVSIDTGIHDVVVGDPVRLNQVLINLAGNAIKFTENGSVSIELTKGDDESAIRFSIIDTGIGIPQEKLQTVFEEFSQVNASDNRKYGGTGLGLSISRQLVELMGGKISISSTEGTGTTFSFMVTCEKGSAENLEQRLASEEQVDGSILDGLSILVVDDNEYNRIVAKDTLESKSGASVIAVESGAAAIDLLKSTEFDVVLMDVQMPGMNGFEATRQIRSRKYEVGSGKDEVRTGAKRSPVKPNSEIPIIALTASVLRTDLDKCTAAGMDGYIPKPVRASQLITGIARVMNIALRVEKKIEPKNVPVPTISSKVTNLDYLTKFCEGDQARMKKYIDMFLTSAPILLEKIKVALASNDHIEIAGQMHGYKTKFMMMGMREAQGLATEIEIQCLQGNNMDSIQVMLLLLVQKIETALKELKNEFR
ncbi:MAG: ATP-binding protein [Bacteroidetes bacterium]|nr:ATP-binding protein [Bacteroidota bacterium]